MLNRRHKWCYTFFTKGNLPVDLRPNGLLDATNIALLRLLQADPRQPVSELARQVRMSAPAVRERLMRLEEAGVIRGYRVELDPKALGLPVTAIIRVRPAPGQLQRVAELAREMPNIVECHRITGEDCFIVKIHLDAVDSLDGVLDRFLAYGTTTTSIVQSSPVPPRSPPLPSEPARNFLDARTPDKPR
jgi:Lrp/AsnC family leucine-responsive transcriptional regulator